MTPDDVARIRHKLVHAVTEHDRKLEKRQPNIYRLGHYLAAIDKIMADIGRGLGAREACRRCVGDRVLAACLRALGEPAPTAEEARGDYWVWGTP